ncbi:DJ-1/PfpI/YhbO family deglycase/protease, partial [Methanocaldococcus infernus]
MKKYLFIIIFFVLLSMCINNKVESMKGKILMVIAPENFRDEELFEPMAVFENNGYAVDIASTKKGVCKGMLGAEVKVNLTIDEVDPKNYVAIVIVGGTGSPKYLWHNEKLINLVKEFYEENKTVAAICLSPVVLAEAGILKGKEATVFPAKEALE